MASIYCHPTANVSTLAEIGTNTKIWHEAQIREGVSIGQNCIIGKGVYIDFDVSIGNNVKIQNRACIYHGCSVADGVFIGPHVVFTNDRFPRAINADNSLKIDTEWEVGKTIVEYGASLGAGTVVLPGVVIGRFSLVGAGSIVTKNVPNYGLVMGNPARLAGYACICARRLEPFDRGWKCSFCQKYYEQTKDGMVLRNQSTSKEEG